MATAKLSYMTCKETWSTSLYGYPKCNEAVLVILVEVFYLKSHTPLTSQHVNITSTAATWAAWQVKSSNGIIWSVYMRYSDTQIERLFLSTIRLLSTQLQTGSLRTSPVYSASTVGWAVCMCCCCSSKAARLPRNHPYPAITTRPTYSQIRLHFRY